MKKSIVAYSISILALSANISYAASGAGYGGAGRDHDRHHRHPVSSGSGAGAMPSHHRSAAREDIVFSCANAALGAYPDDDGADTTMYLVTQGYSIDQPNERILIARKGGERRGELTSSIIAFRGMEDGKDRHAGTKVLIGTGWDQSVDMLGGRPIPKLMEEEGFDGRCIGRYAEIFNGLLRDIQSVLYRSGDSLTITGHSMGGVLAQYAALEAYAKLREPVDSVITFGSPPAFEGPVISFFDSIITHERYFLSNDLVPQLGHGKHTGKGHKLVYSGYGDEMANHAMIKYLDAVGS